MQMHVRCPWTSRSTAGTVGTVVGIDRQATVTLPEAARWLGLTVPCVAALVDRGELLSVRDPDGSVRILTAALNEWAGQRGRG